MTEKTEAPTPRRRAEFRRQGQFARSLELAPAFSLLAIGILLYGYGKTLFGKLAWLMDRTFRYGLTTQNWTVEAVYEGALKLELLLVQLIAPLLLVALVVGVSVNLAQTRFLFTTYPLKPNLDRIHPMARLRQIFSRRGLVELIKTIAKMWIIAFVAYRTLVGNAESLAAIASMELQAGARVLASVGLAMVLRVAVALVLLAALDYLFQRYQFERDIRMTKREMLEELKSIEGDPLIKSRRRQAQIQVALQRMMQAVPQADVVVTNPTHLAVALQYKAQEMIAPTVIAKGQRRVAERIVELARQHHVPIVHNVTLARALFDMVEVGEQIPPKLYQAVAEVLAFVYRLRHRQPGE